MIYLISILLFGFSCSLLANYAFNKWQGGVVHRRLTGENKKEAGSIILRICGPTIRLVRPLFKKVDYQGYRKYIDKKIVIAGLSEKMDVSEFMSLQFVLSIFFILFCMVLTGQCQPAAVLLAFAAGLVYPLLWARSLAARRRKEITYRLPYVMDMLSLSVEAGLDFISGVSRIADKGSSSFLISELRHMIGLIKLGSSRAVALSRLRERVDHPSIDSFVATLLQAEELGCSIGPILKSHAEKLRSDRFQAAEKAGVIASQKILVPLMFCIMPAVFVVVFGPLVVMWKTGTIERLFGQ